MIHEVLQGSPEWLALKAGKFTASNAGKLFSKDTKGYNDLIDTVVYGRLTGECPESYSNEWMERGVLLESEARERYEMENFVNVETVGFVTDDSDPDWVGCSPDGLIEHEGMVQIKCPKYNTMLGYLYKKDAPVEYVYQCQFEMMVTGRNWNDLFLYHPKLPTLMIRVDRSESVIEKIRLEIARARVEVEKRLKIVKQ